MNEREYLPKGTLLRSKPTHPNPSALAIITEEPNDTDFQIIFWIKDNSRSALSLLFIGRIGLISFQIIKGMN